MEKAFKKRFVILMLPTLIAFIIAFIIPFVLGIYLSFTKFTTVTDAQWIGLSNYIVAFRDKDFLASLLFTVKFVLVNLVTINLIAFMLAYVLSRKLRAKFSIRDFSEQLYLCRTFWAELCLVISGS